MNLLSYIHAYGTSEGVKKEWDTRGRGKSWKDLHGEFKTVFKKHSLDYTALAKPSVKDVFQQGGMTGLGKGVLQVHGDGSWEHSSNWSGRHGTLPKTYGKGSGSQSLDEYLGKQSK